MKLRVPAEPTEAEFQWQLLELCQLLGYSCVHFRPGRTKHGWATAFSGDGRGFPDTIIVGHGRCIFAELKVGANKLTDEQERWLERLTACGVLAFCWRPADFPEIVEMLKGNRRAV